MLSSSAGVGPPLKTLECPITRLPLAKTACVAPRIAAITKATIGKPCPLIMAGAVAFTLPQTCGAASALAVTADVTMDA